MEVCWIDGGMLGNEVAKLQSVKQVNNHNDNINPNIHGATLHATFVLWKLHHVCWADGCLFSTTCLIHISYTAQIYLTQLCWAYGGLGNEK